MQRNLNSSGMEIDVKKKSHFDKNDISENFIVLSKDNAELTDQSKLAANDPDKKNPPAVIFLGDLPEGTILISNFPLHIKGNVQANCNIKMKGENSFLIIEKDIENKCKIDSSASTGFVKVLGSVKNECQITCHETRSIFVGENTGDDNKFVGKNITVEKFAGASEYRFYQAARIPNKSAKAKLINVNANSNSNNHIVNRNINSNSTSNNPSNNNSTLSQKRSRENEYHFNDANKKIKTTHVNINANQNENVVSVNIKKTNISFPYHAKTIDERMKYSLETFKSNLNLIKDNNYKFSVMTMNGVEIIHQLFDYQFVRLEQGINALLSGSNYLVYELATGLGKSVVLATLISQAPGIKTVLVTSRVNLEIALKNRLAAYAPHLKVVMLGEVSDEVLLKADVVICTYQALERAENIQKLFPNYGNNHFQMLMEDEAHNSTGPKIKAEVLKLIGAGKVKIIGFDATPIWQHTTHTESVYALYGYDHYGLNNPITPMRLLESIAKKTTPPIRTFIVNLNLDRHRELKKQLKKLENKSENASSKKLGSLLKDDTFINLVPIELYCTGRDPKNNEPNLGQHFIVFTAGIEQGRKIAELANQHIVLTEHPVLCEMKRQFEERMRIWHLSQRKNHNDESQKNKTKLTPTFKIEQEFFNKNFDNILAEIKSKKAIPDKYQHLYYRYRFEIACAVDSGDDKKISDAKLFKYEMGGIVGTCGTAMLNEGADSIFPSVVFDASGSQSPLVKTQRIGRALRINKNNTNKIVRYYDLNFQIKGQCFAYQVLDHQMEVGPNLDELDGKIKNAADVIGINKSIEYFEGKFLKSNSVIDKIHCELPNSILSKKENNVTEALKSTRTKEEKKKAIAELSSKIEGAMESLKIAMQKSLDTLKVTGFEPKKATHEAKTIHDDSSHAKKSEEKKIKDGKQEETLRRNINSNNNNANQDSLLDAEQINTINALREKSEEMKKHFEDLFKDLLKEDEDDNGNENEVDGNSSDSDSEIKSNVDRDTDHQHKKSKIQLDLGTEEAKETLRNIRSLKNRLNKVVGQLDHYARISSPSFEFECPMTPSSMQNVEDQFNEALDVLGKMSEIVQKDEFLNLAKTELAKQVAQSDPVVAVLDDDNQQSTADDELENDNLAMDLNPLVDTNQDAVVPENATSAQPSLPEDVLSYLFSNNSISADDDNNPLINQQNTQPINSTQETLTHQNSLEAFFLQNPNSASAEDATEMELELTKLIQSNANQVNVNSNTAPISVTDEMKALSAMNELTELKNAKKLFAFLINIKTEDKNNVSTSHVILTTTSSLVKQVSANLCKFFNLNEDNDLSAYGKWIYGDRNVNHEQIIYFIFDNFQNLKKYSQLVWWCDSESKMDESNLISHWMQFYAALSTYFQRDLRNFMTQVILKKIQDAVGAQKIQVEISKTVDAYFKLPINVRHFSSHDFKYYDFYFIRFKSNFENSEVIKQLEACANDIYWELKTRIYHFTKLFHTKKHSTDQNWFVIPNLLEFSSQSNLPDAVTKLLLLIGLLNEKQPNNVELVDFLCRLDYAEHLTPATTPTHKQRKLFVEFIRNNVHGDMTMKLFPEEVSASHLRENGFWEIKNHKFLEFGNQGQETKPIKIFKERVGLYSQTLSSAIPTSIITQQTFGFRGVLTQGLFNLNSNQNSNVNNSTVSSNTQQNNNTTITSLNNQASNSTSVVRNQNIKPTFFGATNFNSAWLGDPNSNANLNSNNDIKKT